MIFYSEISINKMIIHAVGNKLKGDALINSASTVVLGSEMEEVLLRFMLSPFRATEFFNFGNLKTNPIFQSVKTIFSIPDVFVTESKKIAQHLYEEMKNPKANSGNLFVVHFKDAGVGDTLVDAVGIFKADIADTYLKIKPSNERFSLERETGINITKLAKGVMIFNYEGEDGYLISVVDKKIKNEEISYWKENFLDIVPRQDEYYQTKNAIMCAEQFVDVALPNVFDINRSDQVELLNKTLEYFKSNDEFEWANFSNEVFETDEVIQELDKYKVNYEKENDVEIIENFTINVPAVKKSQKLFKSVIKLDDKFDIVIHKDKDNLIRGEDKATGLNFYQLLFKNEE